MLKLLQRREKPAPLDADGLLGRVRAASVAEADLAKKRDQIIDAARARLTAARAAQQDNLDCDGGQDAAAASLAVIAAEQGMNAAEQAAGRLSPQFVRLQEEHARAIGELDALRTKQFVETTIAIFAKADDLRLQAALLGARALALRVFLQRRQDLQSVAEIDRRGTIPAVEIGRLRDAVIAEENKWRAEAGRIFDEGSAAP